MEEIWKDIKGYEGLYQISNFGNIKSLVGWNGNKYIKKYYKREKILKKSFSTTGYLKIGLKKDGKFKNYKVHRLVAEAFIPNPCNYPIINHINGNKIDNRIENLEWCTYSYNTKEAYKLGLNFKKIDFTLENNVIKDYKMGLTTHEIILKNNIDKNKYYNILKRNNLKIQEKYKYSRKYKIDKKELKKDFYKNKNNEELSEKYNCSKAIIATYRTKYRKGEM